MVPLLDGEADLYGFVDALLLRLEVVEEEIHVECSLHNARNPDNDVGVVILVGVAVNPVDDVKSSVQTKQSNCRTDVT